MRSDVYTNAIRIRRGRDAILVRPNIQEQCAAIRQLIRPNELIAEAHEVRVWAVSLGVSLAEAIALWFRNSTLAYVADPQFGDVWQSPRRTLFRGGGDCEDFAILAASLFRAMGVRANVVLGWFNGRYHAWVIANDPNVGVVSLEPQGGRIVRGGWIPGYTPVWELAPEFCRNVQSEVA